MTEFRRIETGKLACLEGNGPYPKLGALFTHLEAFLQERRVPAKGVRLAILYEDPLTADPGSTHYVAARELAGETVGDGEITIVIQPAGWVACEVHRGPYADRGEAYRRLADWVRDQGYRITGPAREYYLEGTGPGSGGDEGQAVTELHWPVERVEP